eukprot:403358092
MKLNNSINSKNYYSQTANPAHPVNQTIQYGVSDYNLSQTRPGTSNYQESKKRSMSNTRGYPQSHNFATVDHNLDRIDINTSKIHINGLDSPQFMNNLHFNYQTNIQSKGRASQSRIAKENQQIYKERGLLQDNYDIVNQTIQPQYNRDNFHSIQVNNFTKGSKDAINFDLKYDEMERALSYNIMKAHKTIQQVEQECEQKLIEEKKRFKEKENDNKQKMKQLVSKIENEKDKRLSELTNISELKKKQQSQQNQQKLTKKLLKRETQLDEIQEQHDKYIRKLQKELSTLQLQNKELEFELFSYKKQGQLTIQDQTVYEDRIKKLLLDLEHQSKKYIHEINSLHEQYRPFVHKCGELEERIKVYQVDSEHAKQNERNIRKENVRLKLTNEEMAKKIQQLQASTKQKQQTCQKCIQMMQTIQYSETNANQKNNNMQTINYNDTLKQEQRYQEQTNNIANNDAKTQPKDKKENPRKPKIEQTQQEQQVLENLVENIQQNSALCNGHIRRLFSLKNILFKGNKMISKNQMMDELSEYDNLIRAMGALFYTSKKMGDQIPCIFQAWKEYSFEMRANKIRNLLSESQVQNVKQMKAHQSHNQNDSINQRDNMSGTQQFKQALGSQGMTIQYYENNQSEDYFEDNEDINAGEEEEFMKVGNSNQSYSILPVNNLKATDGRQDSQYEDGEEEDISIDDDDDDIQQDNQQEEKQQKWDFNEDDPEVQNAKLLEKYAQMQGVTMDQMMNNLQDNEGQTPDENQQMIFVDEDGQEIDHQTVMMMMNQEGLVQGPDGQFYYRDDNEDIDQQQQYDDDDDLEEEDLNYQDIITADDFINDDEEAQAKLLKEKQKLKEKILHQPSTSNDGSSQRKANKRVNQLAYYEEMDEDGNLCLYEKR